MCRAKLDVRNQNAQMFFFFHLYRSIMVINHLSGERCSSLFLIVFELSITQHPIIITTVCTVGGLGLKYSVQFGFSSLNLIFDGLYNVRLLRYLSEIT